MKKLLAPLFAFKDWYFPDPIFRVPRIWSNTELAKFSGEITGSVVNVSGWADSDKRKRKYRDYFPLASSYDLTNYSGTHGLQGTEFFLDLEADLPKEYEGKWDVVFNHTTLEHVFEIRKAFSNLCKMARKKVIIVVPWYQQLHYSDSYGDYWRPSRMSVTKMFTENGLKLDYLSQGGSKKSQYIFAIGSKTN